MSEVSDIVIFCLFQTELVAVPHTASLCFQRGFNSFSKKFFLSGFFNYSNKKESSLVVTVI